MARLFTPIPLTGLAFPKSEYERRLHLVVQAMGRAEIDALVVTDHAHLQYLSGYNGSGGYFAPFPLIIVPGRRPIYVVREYEVAAVRTDSWIDEIVPYTQQQDFSKATADVLHQVAVHNKRVGFELGCWHLAPNDVSAIQAWLPEMKVVDATTIVTSVAAVKSDVELAVVREAMTYTDVAIDAFHKSLRAGVTEKEVTAHIQEKVEKMGGALSPDITLSFGERTRLPHGRAGDFPIGGNEPAMIECGGIVHGYVIALVRSAVLGRHPETESIYELSVEALEAAIEAIKPGVTASEVDAAARKVIEKSGRSRAFRHRAGYQTGINWSERGSLSLDPQNSTPLRAGMTLHMPIILFSENEYLFGCSEHVLVTEDGVEVLSKTSRQLFRA
ncbi:M24 family metallopeptidase [Sinorhizobium meliloti]|uniref:M24 family metallopeptidase n=1 Tax=Rhizobium meliloti TaxID=382 RepID=UPI001297421F|nr:Xaa-Pro peptidase family protein [Sinorhizobium meliloti]MQX90527.1 M24 family metallopeptidase [Sinorhizobium meliloti]